MLFPEEGPTSSPPTMFTLKLGPHLTRKSTLSTPFVSPHVAHGWKDIIERGVVLDISNGILDENGSLKIYAGI